MLFCITQIALGQTTQTFNFTGSEQIYIVPNGVTSITVEAYGAQGADGSNGLAAGGLGGYTSGTLSVTPGQTIYIYVGGQGNTFNGGALGGSAGSGNGGGASDIRIGGNTLADRVMVAGGGGGGGGVGCEATWPGGAGGVGGGGDGAKGTDSPDGGGGFGGTVGAGGLQGIGCAGFLGAPGLANGQGGNGQNCCCFGAPSIPGGGGGGGGYEVGGGGGGGSAGTVQCSGNNKGGGGGGAGGTNYISQGFTLTANSNGIQSGDGMVKISILSVQICPEDITVSTDSSSCGKIIDYVVNAPAKGSYLQTAGLPTGSEFPVGTTTNCFQLTDSLNVISTCCFTVTVIDSVAPVAECKSAGGKGKAAYLRNNEPDPWQNGNVIGMNKVFGDGKWDDLRFSVVQADSLFSEKYSFIFIDGCDDGAWEMEAFIGQNRILMEDWVSKGGSLFLNAAPNIDNGMELGFGGYQLAYPSHTSTAIANLPDHPIFNGPNLPVGIEWVGNGFGHAVIAPPDQTYSTLIVNKDNNQKVLIEAKWGKGTVLMGGMTLPIFQEPGYGSGPHPEIENLHTNMLQYLADKVNHVLNFELDKNGQVTITAEDIDGGSTDNCQIATMEIDRTQFTKADLGEQIVTLTVSDYAGNSSTCQSTITITEPKVEKPKAVCQPIDINLDADGTYKLDSLDMVEITGLSPDSLLTFDDMKIFAYPDTFTCANIEWPVFVRITEYDKDYNKTRCWAMVTVHDSTPPTVVGKDMDLMLDETGLAMITTEQLMDSATVDGCGIDTAYIDKNTFTCANIGENWVILSVADIHGNVGTDSVLVNVTVDMPVIDSIADVDVTTAIGVCETTIDYPLPAINEICGISATLTSGLGRDGLFPVGTTTESWMIIDYKGDTTNVSFNVTVTAPNAFPSFDVIDSVVVDNSIGGFMVLVYDISYGNDCSAQTVTISAESDNPALVESFTIDYYENENFADLSVKLVANAVGRARITVTVTDSEGASMFRHFDVIVNAKKEGQIATAVWTREIEMGVNMYPNPAKDQVTIDIKDYNAAQTEVSVFTIAGSEVLRKTYFNGETIRFSIKEQVSGIYLVKMNIDGNNITKKLVVDKK